QSRSQGQRLLVGQLTALYLVLHRGDGDFHMRNHLGQAGVKTIADGGLSPSSAGGRLGASDDTHRLAYQGRLVRRTGGPVQDVFEDARNPVIVFGGNDQETGAGRNRALQFLHRVGRMFSVLIGVVERDGRDVENLDLNPFPTLFRQSAQNRLGVRVAP